MTVTDERGYPLDARGSGRKHRRVRWEKIVTWLRSGLSWTERRERIAAALHSGHFWCSEVVGAGAIETALETWVGPWIGFLGFIVATFGTLGLIAFSDWFFGGEVAPERIAIVSMIFLLAWTIMRRT